MRSIRNIGDSLFSQVLHKGGGGGSSTTSSGIDPEFKPYLQRALGDAEAMRRAEAGQAGMVEQDAALRRRGVAEDILNRQSLGQRAYDRTLGQAQGAASAAGNLGSARAQAAAQSAALNAELDRGLQEDTARAAAAREYGAAAEQFTDAPHRSLERFFGYLGNAPQQQTTQQSGGGK